MRSFIFQSLHPSQNNMIPKANDQKKKEEDMSDLSSKKNQKVLMKIEELVDVSLNSTNFVPHALVTSAPPSGYALNLQALIKVSKVS
jgi:hypothetical protein